MNVLSRASAAALLSLPLAAVSAAANQVFVVDDVAGPGVDFTSIQSAINAAAEGDVVLIKSGNYPAGGGTTALSIANKSVTLVAENAATVNIAGSIGVTSLAAGKQVALRGLKVQATDMGSALVLSNDAGSVWIEDCTLASSSTVFPFLPTGHGVQATNCASVILARCSLSGATPMPTVSPGFHGLSSSSSNVCLYDCQLTAGNGTSGCHLCPGGDGANVAGGFLFASGCTFTGGKGAKGADAAGISPCTNGSTGGDGVHLASGAPVLSTLACTFVAGNGGAPGAPGPFLPCSAGAPGQSLRIDSGSHTPLAGAAHQLTVTATVREGKVLTKTYGGPAGELVFVDYSGFQGFAYFEAFRGVLVFSLAQPFFTVFEGTMPGSGTLTKTVTINPLAPGTEGVTIYLQGGFFDITTGIFQGAPSATVLLDSAF